MEPFIQLRADDSIIHIARRAGKVNAIIVCEGATESEALKLVARRLSIAEKLGRVRIAVTDAEGINALRREVLPAILALVIGRVARRVEAVGVIVDSEDLEPRERLNSLLDGLRGRGYKVESVKELCSSVWEARLKIEDRLVPQPLIVAVNSLHGNPYLQHLTAHSIESHLALLKILEGVLDPGEARTASKPKTLAGREDLQLITRASLRNVEEAFGHFACLLEALARHLNVAL